MKSKNKHLRPPPRKPWMLDNTSSSSLRNMEIGIPPRHQYLPPTPAAVSTYEAKPLPPLPLRRSGRSSFSSEIQSAFKTPLGADYHLPKVKREERRLAIGVILDEGPHTSGMETMVDSGRNFTGAFPEDIDSLTHTSSVPRQRQCIEAGSAVSLAPSNASVPSSARNHTQKPTGSVQKLLEITGAGSVASLALSNTSLTPSGHNPTQKIKQIMGFEVSLGQFSGSPGPTEEISPLTPRSRSSSIYSQSPSDAGSDIYHGRAQLSTPETSVTLSSRLEPPDYWRPASVAPSAIPDSLRIVKTNGTSPTTEPVNERGFSTTNNYGHAYSRSKGGFRQALYHDTVSDLARNASSSSVRSETSKYNVCALAPDSSYSGVSITEAPQRQPSFSFRPYQSKTRFGPQLNKLDTPSATKYSAPIKTPYPSGMSQIEFDDDPTPTQRDYDSDVLPRALGSSKSPSIMDRITTRASSPLSASTLVTSSTLAELPPSPAQRSHSSALPSPLHLIPPPLLKHRKVKSQDTLRSHNRTVLSTNTNTHDNAINRGKSSMTTNHAAATTSRRAAFVPQTHPASPSLTPTPLPQQTSGNITALRTHNKRFASISTLFVRRSTQHPEGLCQPPPILSSGRTRAPANPFPFIPSLAESAVSALTTWAGRAAERLERVRQAAGIRTRSERRRLKLKSSIKVIGPGKLGDGTPPPAVGGKTSAKQNGQKGRGGEEKKRKATGKEKVRVGMKFEKYSTERAPEKVGLQAIVAPVVAVGKAVAQDAQVASGKAAEKARRREKAADAAGAKVWV